MITIAASLFFVPDLFAQITGTWTSKTPLLTARSTAGVATDGVRVYGVVEAYDPAANAWSARAPMPTPRGGLRAVALGGRIYAIGGFNSSGVPLVTVEVYDPVADTSYFAAAAVSGRIPVAGGHDGANFNRTEHFVYEPASNAWTTAAPLPTGRYGLGGAAVRGVLYTAGAPPAIRQRRRMWC